MKDKINPKELSGEDLLYYMTNDYPDKDYSSIVELLPLACGDIDKAYSILEKSVNENKILVAVYPGEGETDTSDLDLIGEIQDGALYIKK